MNKDGKIKLQIVPNPKAVAKSQRVTQLEQQLQNVTDMGQQAMNELTA